MMVCTYRQCLPEIAASACGLLAMTNLRAVRHKINTANIADLHGAQGKPQRACFRRFPFHVKGGPLRMSSDIIPAALSGFIIKAGFSKKGRLYTREHHDIMQCILFERPSSLIYPTYFIMPLYIPCSTRYLTYGRRISEITNGRNSKQIDVDRLISALQKEVLPFFERIATPQLLMEYLLTARDVQRYFFCPPVRIAMLKAYTALYLHDRSLFSRMAAETGQLIPADRCSSEAVARRMHAELEVLKAQARLSDAELAAFFAPIIETTRRVVRTGH